MIGITPRVVQRRAGQRGRLVERSERNTMANSLWGMQSAEFPLSGNLLDTFIDRLDARLDARGRASIGSTKRTRASLRELSEEASII